jgi:ankyrin repeat protein
VQLIIILERWDLLEVILEYPSIPLDSIDEYQNNIMHYLALQGKDDILGRMLNLQVNIMQKNFQGDEPLHTCIYTDSLECFIGILNKCGRPEAHEEFIISKKNNKNENCLTLSILHRAYRIFRYCLGIMKKLEYLDENQKYPLNYIIDANNYEFLEAYLACNPNLKVVNSNKENVLFYCLRHNKTSFFKVAYDLNKKLLQHFDEDTLFNKSKEGQTVLHAAAMFGNLTATRLLMEYNMDVAEVDTKGKTALDYAKAHPDIYDFLLADK